MYSKLKEKKKEPSEELHQNCGGEGLESKKCGLAGNRTRDLLNANEELYH